MIDRALATSDHPTASEVYDMVRQDCPQVSLGTIYRNLASMAEGGEILRLSFAGTPDRFDPNTFEHFHVVCKHCGRVFDADCAQSALQLERLVESVEHSTGVAIEQHNLMFSGTCKQCAKTCGERGRKQGEPTTPVA
jgi:Fe2+ or Zn2+ uptake regulation protein